MHKDWQINKKGELINGLERICAGMNLSDILIYPYVNRITKLNTESNNWIHYKLDNVIELSFNSESKVLETIYLEEGVFQGSFNKLIKIGNRLQDVLKIVKDEFVIDDNYLFINKGKIGFMVDVDLECEDEKDWGNLKITRIILCQQWLSNVSELLI